MTALTLHLPLPPPLSACFTNNARAGRVKTKRYKAWIKEATFALHEELRRDRFWRKTITVDVCASYQFGKPDKRKQDVANREKAVSDLLVRAGILADDSQIVDLRLRWADVDGCLATIWNAKVGE